MQSTRRSSVAALAMAGVLMLGLGACADDPGNGTSATDAVTTDSASAADIAFAQAMIPHHEQAVAMADMALDPDSGASAQLQSLAAQIKAAQAPEIEQMTGWLQAWGAPATMPGADDPMGLQGMDHSGHDMGGLQVHGMMTAEQMAGLGGMRSEAFDDMWLRMMIEHHEGAIAMAEQVATTTRDPEVAGLAEAIITTQAQEIATMEAMLG